MHNHCFLTKQLIAKDMYRSFLELTVGEGPYGWFLQNSATAHTAHKSMQALSNVFGDRIISSGILSASSPNLNLCNLSPEQKN
jgi:hypothetical protein